MVDYKAALVNAGAFAVGAASFIAGIFILPEEFGNLERLIMVVSVVGVYSVGHAKGQRFAEGIFSSEKENLQKTQMISEMQPKATYYDLILQSASLVPITSIVVISEGFS